jgi:hypothetical protein
MIEETKLSEAPEDRTLAWIEAQLGDVSKLSEELISVIWVTVYRAMEIGNQAQPLGSRGLVSDKLRGGNLWQRMREAAIWLQLLKEIVPVIKSSESSRIRAADSQLLVDILKWEMFDAADMSRLRRAVARRRAKPDPMYDRPVPLQLIRSR